MKVTHRELALRKTNSEKWFDAYFEHEQDDTLVLKFCDYVYIINAVDTDLYKIGFTYDPPGRIRALRQQSPHELEFVLVRKFRNVRKVEKSLHYICREYRAKGEWFKFPPEILKAVKTVFTAPEKVIIGGRYGT